jgi:hypothetical protein
LRLSHFNQQLFVLRQQFVRIAILRIGVNWLAEIVNIGNISGFFGRCGQADLRSGMKIFQDSTPDRIFFGAAAVAFVDDNQIKNSGVSSL